MPSHTPSNGFLKQDLASNVNRWGDPLLNVQLDLIDDALDGVLVLSVAPLIVLTNDVAVPNQARHRVLRVGGGQAADCVIQVPNVEKRWWVWNETTGGNFTVRVKTAASVGVLCNRGAKTLVMCDSVATFQLSPGAINDLSAPTGDFNMGGFKITGLGDGANPNHAATVGQVTAAMGAPSPYIQYLLQMFVT